MLEIVDIDITLPFSTFTNIMNVLIADESSNKGISFDWSWKDAHLTRSNTNMYKIIFNNLDSSNDIEVVANKLTNDISFKPIALRNYNNSFFKWNYQDDDLVHVFLLALKKCAMKSKGNFGCIFDGNNTLVQKGRDISNHITGYALIDDNGKVYNLNGKQELDEDEDTGPGYVPKYLINDWLDENPAFQMKMQGINQQDRFELMAQFAIYQKRKDMINADQFRDILIQVGNIAEMFGGFKDESVKSIYQFFA